MSDRIWFAKNPWPKGHAIISKHWSGRLDPGRGLIFDLDLQSAEYRAEGDPPETEDDGDWNSPVVWNNYHRCSLSSVKWGDQGFVVGTVKKPLVWSALDGATFHVSKAKDVLPDQQQPRAFGIYLLGHDGVADHSIAFTKTARTFGVSWKAKIALAYAGQTELEHRMKAELCTMKFEGFSIPKGMTSKAARSMFDTLVTDPKKWKLERRRFIRQ